MFKRILIANRGEIAVRIIRACNDLNIESVAIYSRADRESMHVKMATHTYPISEDPIKGYLDPDLIIQAAKEMEAEAIHPGYGFLSENAFFAKKVKEAGIVWIGPDSEVIAKMGDKNAARNLMIANGIPVVPGTEPLNTLSMYEIQKIARKIGYPVILKAAAGGGGRGMRIVEKEENMFNAYLAAESEAISAFGDGTIYMEKFIDQPKHIEVQILADKHGNVLHVGERDCSLQRRHQKLIEESPAPTLEPKTREKLLQTAITATKAIKYVGAGTYEFLLDSNQNFYFMEMNTRLQVEHPVSELVSGLDIIELMIRIAEGQSLPKQEEIHFKCCAMECRITAEDPVKFYPSAGKITKWIAPGGGNVRLDTHAYAGYVVPMFYDSMIGKLIVWGKNRKEAIARMSRALDEFCIEGIKTTIAFHQEMMKNEDFKRGVIHTKYLEQKMANKAEKK